ncbi:MAG: metallophosphoesterase family protein [Paludibacteraceae bacterium]|nr:metallophosphoesterase family protein [Paludibacteraceae bacterium]
MVKIGLLSDTHSYLDRRVFDYFASCDEIWHAGDIGSAEVLQQLREFKPTRAVFGNMDGGEVRYTLSEFYRFRIEQVNVLMTHIGGYPGRYNPWLLPMFKKSKEAKSGANPDDHNIINLFVCGHSHILKVQYDHVYDFLTLNPGAAGKQGWQTVQTLLRFTIDGRQIKDMEVIEMR